MSDQEKKSDAQNVVDSSEEIKDTLGTISIPVSSEELPDSDQTEDNEYELEPSGWDHERPVEDSSDQSLSSLELNDIKQLMEDVMSTEEVSHSPRDSGDSLTKSDNEEQSAKKYSKDSLRFLEKVKAVKESLRTSTKDSSATGTTQGIEVFFPLILKNGCFLFVFACIFVLYLILVSFSLICQTSVTMPLEFLNYL